MSISVQQAISPKAIMIAAGLACFVYAGMLVFTLINGSSALNSIEDKMAAQSIAFDRPFVEADVSTGTQSMVDAKDLSALIGANAKSLPAAPYEGLIEDSASGPLPMVGKNKLTPFDAYKKPYVFDVKKPVIALAVKGIGFSSALYPQSLERLTPQVSLILSPYVPNIHAIQKEVREKGYETWLELPFENEAFPYNDPGSKGILANAGLQFNQKNYESVLAATSGYAGVVGFTDNAFLNSKPTLEAVISDVYTRGLGYFELNAARDAMSAKITPDRRESYLTNSYRGANDVSLAQRFSALKNIAENNIAAVGVLEISPAMLDGFQAEFLKAREEGFEIAPLSAVADTF